MKIVEPAIDLGVLVAVASSFCNRPIDSETVVFGEVGLGGEVRTVSRVESRIKEAIHLGFRRCCLPKGNLKGLKAQFEGKIDLCGVEKVEDAIQALLS
jgi:DNA repair protein RadA/Sms